MFEDTRNIEIAHQLAYQKVVREENYLELSKEKTTT